MPARIQLSRQKNWRKPAGVVVVARPTRWGNPWRVGIDGDAAHCVAEYRRLLTSETVSAWPKGRDDWLLALRLEDDRFPLLLLAKKDLRGHDLACWCQLDQPCHADILLELANA
jgi:hypothetical protein